MCSFTCMGGGMYLCTRRGQQSGPASPLAPAPLYLWQSLSLRLAGSQQNPSDPSVSMCSVSATGMCGTPSSLRHVDAGVPALVLTTTLILTTVQSALTNTESSLQPHQNGLKEESKRSRSLLADCPGRHSILSHRLTVPSTSWCP